jgi:hypothetical protein
MRPLGMEGVRSSSIHCAYLMCIPFTWPQLVKNNKECEIWYIVDIEDEI